MHGVLQVVSNDEQCFAVVLTAMLAPLSHTRESIRGQPLTAGEQAGACRLPSNESNLPCSSGMAAASSLSSRHMLPPHNQEALSFSGAVQETDMKAAECEAAAPDEFDTWQLVRRGRVDVQPLAGTMQCYSCMPLCAGWSSNRGCLGCL